MVISMKQDNLSISCSSNFTNSKYECLLVPSHHNFFSIKQKSHQSFIVSLSDFVYLYIDQKNI